jgi:hypothetical protein
LISWATNTPILTTPGIAKAAGHVCGLAGKKPSCLYPRRRNSLSTVNNVNKLKKSTIFFYVNAIIFLPFVLLALSGLLIQINYHAGHMADTAVVLGLNRYAWLLLHKITAVISIIGLSIHIFLHMGWLKAVFFKKLYKKPNWNTRITMWLLILTVATALTGIIPWLLAPAKAHARHSFIDIHDKIGIILIILFVLHIINHWKWITYTFSDILKR